MEYLAHSAREEIPAQTYLAHVRHVRDASQLYASTVQPYAKLDGALLCDCIAESAIFHDLGKLDSQNQAVLHSQSKEAHLKVNHADAGAALLKQVPDGRGLLAAMAIYSHHRGLPNMAEEYDRGKNCFRDKDINTRVLIDGELPELCRIHSLLCGSVQLNSCADKVRGDFGVFARMLLSCLADADHTDTAIHYCKYPKQREAPQLRAEERLEKLEQYVSRFDISDERNKLRSEMYHACKNALLDANITACDSPVGSGKTTSVMAHLLHQAIERKARRVFVILPFTNIIQQSVDVYRKALVLPGEDPTEVVAELHHRADFQSIETRAFNAQWRAPIIVTTAVAFFETIASNRPAGLRRLHELPGSVIFVDEAHAALPVKLLPVAWHWMQVLADEWSCYWVLASGSLVEFWRIPEIAAIERTVPQLVEDSLRSKLAKYENRRIRYEYIDAALSREDLIARIKTVPGPRLVIMNTVQSAGVIAADLLKSYHGGNGEAANAEKVLHLSTALTAEDRDSVIEAVKARLKNKRDSDWTLVATSCVEAGVDFSFRTGFREISSLLSLLQAAGRIGRNGEYEDACIWSFSMQDDSILSRNPMTEDSEKILSRFFQRGLPISPDLCTRAIIAELNQGAENGKPLLREEKKQNYAEVGENFNVIEGDTVLAVADQDFKQKLRFGMADWKDIQRKSVSIRYHRVKKYALPELIDGVYDWNLRYDSFLGIMAGVLDVARSSHEFLDY